MLALEKFKACQLAELKVALVESNLLVETRFEFDFLDVVVFVWGVHHHRDVVGVSLLSHTCVYSDETVCLRVDFE